MNRSLSPPILVIEDDDDDDDNNNNNNNNNIYETNLISSSISQTNLPRKKRRLSNTNYAMNSSIVNYSKRQRNSIESDYDSDMILLDPNDYIIERPNTHAYQSFDWTIQSSKSIPTVSNGNHRLKRSIDKTNIQSTGKITVLPLPLPTQISTINRPNAQRARPVNNSRISTVQPPIQTPRPQTIFATTQSALRPAPTTVLPPPPPPPRLSSASNLTSETRRQILNGTGQFSAFHDSKYYRCNICKFKSATSTTLLQHLFTHMFFCDHCSFYTYSYYNLSQHLFDKHHVNLLDDNNQTINNPKAFDLLYVTRCQDGTFALCLDSSTKSSNNDQRLIISSASPQKQTQNQLFKKQKIHQEKQSVQIHPYSIDNCQSNDQTISTIIIMKYRNKYFKKTFSSYQHSFTLEYQLCRQEQIKQFNQQISLPLISTTIRLIDEVACCLKTIVNQIIDYEENQFYQTQSLICLLPNSILQLIFSDNKNLLQSVNLKAKYSQQQINKNRFEQLTYDYSSKYRFILSSYDNNQTQQSILAALHSTITNGESVYTQIRMEKLPAVYDNSHRYLQNNSNRSSKNINSTSKTISTRQITPKITRPSIDKNNNSLMSSSSNAASMPNVIVLD